MLKIRARKGFSYSKRITKSVCALFFVFFVGCIFIDVLFSQSALSIELSEEISKKASQLELPKIEMDISADKTEISVNEKFILSVVVKWRGKAGIYEVKSPDLSLSGNLKVRKLRSSAESVVLDDEMWFKKTFDFVIVGISEGAGQIREVNVRYLPKGSESPLYLNGVGPEVVINPVSAQIPWNLYIWSAIGLVLIFVSLVIYKHIRSRNIERERAESRNEISLEQNYLNELEKLGEDLNTEDVKKYASEAEQLLKKYLCEKYGFNKDLSSDALLDKIYKSEEMGKGDKEIIRKCWEKLEKMKFSGLELNHSEASMLNKEIRNFLESKKIIGT